MQQNTQETLARCSEPRGYNEDWHRADVICGGFPCQDISNAGRRAGITGSRSSLWKYLCGAIRMVRPKYAIVENVAALLGRGMGTVLGDLAEIGYDTEWHCIPASRLGYPQIRDRVWIIANPKCDEWDAWRWEALPLEKEASNKLGRCNWIKEDQSRVDRVANGIPDWMDRLQSLGNSVVPTIPEIIGRMISED